MTSAQVLTQERVERLRLILESEYGRAVSEKEASEIAFQLLGFFENFVRIPEERNTSLLRKDRVK